MCMRPYTSEYFLLVTSRRGQLALCRLSASRLLALSSLLQERHLVLGLCQLAKGAEVLDRHSIYDLRNTSDFRHLLFRYSPCSLQG